jgi:hypothetical protein
MVPSAGIQQAYKIYESLIYFCILTKREGFRSRFVQITTDLDQTPKKLTHPANSVHYFEYSVSDLH